MARYPDSTFLYTDGSKTIDGVGFAFVHGSRCFRYKLPNFCSIFTAKAAAILRALEYAEQQRLYKCVICTDSQSVTTAVRNPDSDQPIVFDLIGTFHRLLAAGYDITLVWIPGHCGISVNEMADTQAKIAVSRGDLCIVPLGYKEYVPMLRKAVRGLFNKLWTDYRPGTALKCIKAVSGSCDTSTRPNRRD